MNFKSFGYELGIGILHIHLPSQKYEGLFTHSIHKINIYFSQIETFIKKIIKTMTYYMPVTVVGTFHILSYLTFTSAL